METCRACSPVFAMPVVVAASAIPPPPCMPASGNVGRTDGDAGATVMEMCGACSPVLVVVAMAAVVDAVVAASEISQTPCMISSCIMGHAESDAAATAMQTRTCHVRAGHVRDTYVPTLPARRDVGGDASLVLGGEAASFEVTRVRRGGGMLRGVGVLLLEPSREVFPFPSPAFPYPRRIPCFAPQSWLRPGPAMLDGRHRDRRCLNLVHTMKHPTEPAVMAFQCHRWACCR